MKWPEKLDFFLSMLLAAGILCAVAVGVVQAFALQEPIQTAPRKSDADSIARGNQISVRVIENRLDNIEEDVSEIRSDVRDIKNGRSEGLEQSLVYVIGALIVGERGITLYRKAKE